MTDEEFDEITFTLMNCNEKEALDFVMKLDPFLFDMRDTYMQTILLVLAERGFEKPARFILSKGASVDLADKYKNTPLFKAVHKKHTHLFSLFSEYGANPSSENEANISPASLALRDGGFEELTQTFSGLENTKLPYSPPARIWVDNFSEPDVLFRFVDKLDPISDKVLQEIKSKYSLPAELEDLLLYSNGGGLSYNSILLPYHTTDINYILSGESIVYLLENFEAYGIEDFWKNDIPFAVDTQKCFFVLRPTERGHKIVWREYETRGIKEEDGNYQEITEWSLEEFAYRFQYELDTPAPQSKIENLSLIEKYQSRKEFCLADPFMEFAQKFAEVLNQRKTWKDQPEFELFLEAIIMSKFNEEITYGYDLYVYGDDSIKQRNKKNNKLLQKWIKDKRQLLDKDIKKNNRPTESTLNAIFEEISV